MPGLPPPETEWATAPRPCFCRACQYLQFSSLGAYLCLGTDPGNASPGVPGDMIPGSKAAVSSALPLLELELSWEYRLERDTGDTSRESQSHHPSAEHCISSHLQPNPNCCSASADQTKNDVCVTTAFPLSPSTPLANNCKFIRAWAKRLRGAWQLKSGSRGGGGRHAGVVGAVVIRLSRKHGTSRMAQPPRGSRR